MLAGSAANTMTVIKFGTFQLDLTDKKLTESGKPFQLGKKSLDILTLLVSRAGEVVSKDELLKFAWPSSTVDEGALRVHLVTLRKALGDHGGHRHIENVAGRGYVFVAPVERLDAASPVWLNISDSNLPHRPGRLIGRESFVASSLEMISSVRLLTISGAGGVGKTAVALEIAERIASSRQVVFIDLAVLSDEKLLMPTLASALGLVVFTNDYLQAVLNALTGSHALLFFDNCEHLIDAVAIAADHILKATANVTLLTTSREALRVAGERVRQLPSLPVPEIDVPTDQLLAFPSVELFVEHVRFASDIRDFEDANSLTAAAAIVRSLDGIPLAIELAASRVSNLGMASVIDSLDDPLAILRRGRRTAPPRHQTLRATLDWSYASLTGDEQVLFALIAVFPGTFSDEAAASVAKSWFEGEAFDDAFDGLLLKSLLSVSNRDGRYRLLDTTRRYAVEKLTESPLQADYRQAHALFCRSELLQAEFDWSVLPTNDWMHRYAGLINDLRSSINWAYSAEGQVDLAIELIAISNVLWVQLGLMNEQLVAVEKALGHLAASNLVGTDIEFQLRTSRASGLYHIKGFKSDDQAIVEFERAAVIADSLGNPNKIMRAYGGKANIESGNGQYLSSVQTAKSLQERFPTATSFSRMLEHNYLFHGDFSSAREQAEISLAEAGRAVRTTLNSGTGYDQGIIAKTVLAMIDFLEGKVDRSFAAVDDLILAARHLGHSISSCLTLCLTAIPVAVMAGDIQDARKRLEEVKRLSGKDMLVRWQEWVDAYSMILPEASQSNEGQSSLQKGLVDAVGMRLEYMTILAGSRAPLEAVEKALSGDAGWCRPELLRLKSVATVREDRKQAMKLLTEGLGLGRSIGAALWELRCAICILRLAPASGRSAARDDVGLALSKFESSRPIADIAMARTLLSK